MVQEIAHVHYVKLLAEKCKADERIKELEAENARLRQQRDAANAQLAFILENQQT